MVKALREYSVVGRHVPTETNKKPDVFRMRLFAKNEVAAKSRFWYYLRQLKKVKRVNGELLACSELTEPSDKVKNYGIMIRYNSRSGIHNMHKEYRDTTRVGAVQQMYAEMAGRHRAQRHNIQVVEVNEMMNDQLHRLPMKEIVADGVRFPIANYVPRPSSKKFRRLYAPSRKTSFAF